MKHRNIMENKYKAKNIVCKINSHYTIQPYTASQTFNKYIKFKKHNHNKK